MIYVGFILNKKLKTLFGIRILISLASLVRAISEANGSHPLSFALAKDNLEIKIDKKIDKKKNRNQTILF